MIGWSTHQRPDLLVKQLLLLLLVMLMVVSCSSTSTASNALTLLSSHSPGHRRLSQTSNEKVGRFSIAEEVKSANARRLSGQYLCRWKREICEQEPISFLLGPDCCNSICTNVKSDIFNCGSCGRICFYGSICCNGDCVDVFNDVKHCGFCLNSCPWGDSCQYGICGYS